MTRSGDNYVSIQRQQTVSGNSGAVSSLSVSHPALCPANAVCGEQYEILLKNRRILIVEDDRSISFMIRKIFEQYGARVMETSIRRTAADLLEREIFDVVVIDYHLPEGDGGVLLSTCREISGCVKIMITGDTSPELAMAWMAQGADAYVLKPFQPDYLVALSAKSLSGKLSERNSIPATHFLQDHDLKLKLMEMVCMENKKLSADLHDTVCQQMTGIAFFAKSVRKLLAQSSPEIINMIREIECLAGNCSQTIRRLVRGLQPLPDCPDALPVALQELAVYVESVFKKRCRCRLPACMHLPDCNMATQLYMIAREATLNAVRHSGGSLVEISLYHEKTGKRLKMEIADDGSGDSLEWRQGKRGLGVNIMRMRARLIGAKLSIRRRSGGGTLVVCHLDHA